MTDRYVKLSASTNAGSGGTISTYLAGRNGLLSAWNASGPGDNILLIQPDNGGDINWTGSLKLVGRSGAPGAPITIKPVLGHRIVLNGYRRWPSLDYRNMPYSECWWVEGHYITIEDISFNNTNAFGLRVNPDATKQKVWSSNITLRRIKTNNNHGGGLLCKLVDNLIVDGCEAKDNECSSNKNPAWDYPDHQAGMSFQSIKGIEVKNSTIWNNAGEGLMIDGTPWLESYPTTNVHVHHNLIGNNPEVNLYLHGLPGAENKLIHDNIFHNTSDASFTKDKGWTGVPPWNGIHHIQLHTIEIWTFKWNAASRAHKIWNNIFVQGIGTIWANDSDNVHQNIEFENNLFLYCKEGMHAWSYLKNPINNRIRNNIFVVGSGQKVITGVLRGSDFASISNNCFYIESGGVGPPSWMRSGSDVNGNPRLKNLSADTSRAFSVNPNNYAPDTDYPSPLINAGITGNWASLDYYGNARTGAWDIGPIESGSGGEPPDIPKALRAQWYNADESGGTVFLNEGETTTFIDATIAQGGATVESRSWSFPGGVPSSSTAASVDVTYNVAGTYQVSLTVDDITNGITNTKTTSAYVYVNEIPPESTDVSYKIIPFNVGDASIPVPFLPKAAMFIIGNCTSSESAIDDLSISVGYRDESGGIAQANTLQQDAVTSIGGFRRGTATGVAQLNTAENTVKFTGSVTGVSASSIAMSWSGDVSGAEVGYLIVAGGDAIVNAKALKLNDLNSVGATQVVDGTYNVAIVLTTLATASWDMAMSYGFAVKNNNKVCAAIYGTNWGTPGRVSTVVRDDAVATIAANSAVVDISFGATSTTFTLGTAILNNNSANDGVHVMLLNTGVLGAACGVAHLPSTTTETTIPLSFDPGLVLMGITNLLSTDSVNTKYDTTTNSGLLALYGAEANQQFTYGIGKKYDGAASAENAFTYTSEDYVQRDGDGTIIGDVTGAATGILPGNGEITMKLDPAPGRKLVWLAIEGSQAVTVVAEEDNISSVGLIAGVRPGAI